MAADGSPIGAGGIAGSAVSPDLVAAYANAHYRIEAPAGVLVVRVGGRDPGLDRLLADLGIAGAALVTADNPHGALADPAANRAAEAALVAEIAARGLASLPTAGLDPTGVWPEEPGRLILGIARAEAVALCRRFDQDALLWIAPGVGPELVMVRRAVGPTATAAPDRSGGRRRAVPGSR